VCNREGYMYLEGKNYWCGWDSARRRGCRTALGAVAYVGRVITNWHVSPPLILVEMEENKHVGADLPSPVVIMVIIGKPTP